MVVANFGMGIRPSSSVVQTDQERQASYADEYARLSNSVASRASNLAARNVANTISMGYNLTPEMQRNIIEFITPGYIGEKNLRDTGATPWLGAGSEARGLLELQRKESGQLDAAPQLYVQQNAAIASSQGAQQNAYTQSLGGFGAGGVVGSVSQAGTRDPSQPTASMPWGQPWSTPGFGNPGSLGGLGGYKPSGQQGWGSVFGGGRNPWSLA